MNSHSETPFSPISPVLIPRALRHGDPDFWRSLYLCGVNVSVVPGRLGPFQHEPVPIQHCPTRTTTTSPLYSSTENCLNPRLRLPCESFTRHPTCPTVSEDPDPARLQQLESEFQHADRLSTTNLIDWTPKESWSCGALRAGVFRSVPLRAGFGDFLLAATVPADRDDIGWNKIGRGSAVPSCAGCRFDLSSDSSDSCSTAGSVYGCSDKIPRASPVSFQIARFGDPASAVTKCAAVAGERNFCCDYDDCCKRFSRKEELTRHRRTHAGDRAFQCRICNRKFIRKDHMTKHMATHEDVSTRKRYECREPGCDRRYTRSDALSRHRSSAHGFTANQQRHNA